MRDVRAERVDIAALARPLRTPADLDPVIEAASEARIVLLGEASHGTSEFYVWRAELTKRLIADHGFSFVAVEGDWPDCFRLNWWAKGHEDREASAREILGRFERWPTWMWANEEVADFLEWLRTANAYRPDSGDVGFYGLDVYSLWDSIHAVTQYVSRRFPEALPAARAALRCFEPYAGDPQEYAWSTRMVGADCEDEVVRMLVDVRNRLGASGHDPEADLDAWQNAEVVRGAERYYRTMVATDERAWNVRDTHMTDTLDRLLAHHGSTARAVVWEHNTHVGDARGTDMAAHELVTVGQLARERHGCDDVFIVGFGGFQGSVIAAPAWGDTAQRMPVPPAPPGTHEYLIHETVGEPALFVFGDERRREWLTQRRGHRAIGVVYDPRHDARGNWVRTVMGQRYDAFVYFDDTSPLHPLALAAVAPIEAKSDTWPFGR